MYKEVEILNWANEKGILSKATPKKQYQKTLEEVYELGQALEDDNFEEIKDAIADIYITLVIQAKLQNISFESCIDSAYEIISKRTGKMVNGVFVKDK